MVKSLLGGLIGGIVLYLVGFIFWGTPLSLMAFSRVDEATNAQLQMALSQALGTSGTGVYAIPDPTHTASSTLYTQGPVSLVQFNTGGFPVMDTGALLSGFVLALVVGIIIALGLNAIADRVTDFASRAKVVIYGSLAATLWIIIGMPIFNHAPWGYHIFLFLSDFIGLAACGLVIARWFLPKAEVASSSGNGVNPE